MTLACISITVVSCDPFWRGKERKRRFKEQTGTYELYIPGTNMRSYLKDTGLYKNLTITYKPDSTFVLNMDVPFLKDSFGIWEAVERDFDYHSVDMMFFSTDKSLLDLEPHAPTIQFALNIYDNVSILEVRNASSKRGYKNINSIKFRKIK